MHAQRTPRLLYGNPDEPATRSTLEAALAGQLPAAVPAPTAQGPRADAADVETALGSLRGRRLGLVGDAPPGFTPSQYDGDLVERLFGIEIDQIPVEAMFDRVEDVADGEAEAEHDDAVAAQPSLASVDGGQALAEFAGRACYQSWAKPNPVTATNAGYLRHILEVGHLSVLEHGSVSFYLTGVSRSLTHELIRHRHFSYSQLSQRYVPERDAAMVEPDVIAADPELHAIFFANLIKPRRDQMRLVLERAVARGEIRDDLDLDLMIDLFAGPAVYRLLITGGDMSKMFAVEDQLDALLNGLRPAASRRT